jgi:hypothetical protein
LKKKINLKTTPQKRRRFEKKKKKRKKKKKNGGARWHAHWVTADYPMPLVTQKVSSFFFSHFLQPPSYSELENSRQNRTKNRAPVRE